MQSNQIERVVIVGGGTAGWIAAAALSKLIGSVVAITLIESDDIGTIGVGEATIPQLRRLNAVLDIDENAFVRETKGTFKLGIEFNNWGAVGERYLHTFGDAGINVANLHFHQYWLRYRAEGGTQSLWDFSLHHKVAYANKFGCMDRIGNTSMTGLSYAFHFDASLYARFLRGVAEASGVVRLEGKVVDVECNGETGYLEAVQLAGGVRVAGDLFVDCSGFRGLLIGQAMGVGYQDWSHWLPCNSAIAVGSAASEPLVPYTKATAHQAGWQWRIPLQHRTGNGHVFCDAFVSEAEATATLLDHLDSAPLGDPKRLRFTTGRRKEFWHKNVVSLGLASGFLEPLESTSIHLIQSNVSRLIELFPTRDFHASNIAEYNRQVGHEYDLIRDFLILHYHLTRRDDSEFWRYCANMPVPDSVKLKMSLFADSGLLYKDAEDLFRESSWVQVMLGQGIVPARFSVRANRISSEQLSNMMGDIRQIIEKAAASLPAHQAFIESNCKADLQ